MSGTGKYVDVPKYINDDDEVAVLYSPGYGSGWSTWNDNPAILFDIKLVMWVLEGKPSNQLKSLEEYVKTAYDEDHIYVGSNLPSLKIRWVPYNTRFIMTEYDGSEEVVLEKEMNWIIA